LHQFGLARPSKAILSTEFTAQQADAGPEQSPIRSRWQHVAVPTWHRIRPIAVCEVAYTVLDLSVSRAQRFNSSCMYRVSATESEVPA
jgi:hypothetical protein